MQIEQIDRAVGAQSQQTIVMKRKQLHLLLDQGNLGMRIVQFVPMRVGSNLEAVTRKITN